MTLDVVAASLLLSPLVAIGATAAIGIAVTREPRRAPALRALFFGSLAVTLWLGGSALTSRAGSPALAARWAGVALAGAALLAPALHRLAVTFGPADSGRRWIRRIQILSWLTALVLAALALAGRLVPGAEPRPWGFQPLYDTPVWALAGFFWFLWVLSLLELGKLARGVGPERRRSVRLLAVAVGIAGLAAAELVPGLEWPMPPLGFLALLAFLALAAVAFRWPAPGVSEQTAERILATVADGLLVCDARGRIEIVNDALCALTGRSRRRLAGTRMEMLFCGSGEQSFVGWDWKRQPVQEALATLDAGSGEGGKDGQGIEVRVSISPLRGELGAVEGAVVLVRDIRDSQRTQLRLGRIERRLTEAQRLARCGFWRWPVGGETVAGSSDLFRTLGLSAGSDDLGWRTIWRSIDRESRGPLRACLERALREGARFEHEVRVRRAGEDDLLVTLRGEWVVDPRGAPVALSGTAQDVSGRYRAEARFGRLLDAAPDPTLILDGEGMILRVNRRVETELGYAQDDLTGRPVEILIPDFERAHKPGTELEARRRDGGAVPVEVVLTPSRDADGPRRIVSIRDLSDRKRLETELTRLTLHDSLTGLPNRALLMDRLRMALDRTQHREGRPFAVLCVGLDRFEDVVSSLGHRIGDELLVLCAERLQQFALTADTVSRIGDHVFVILQDGIRGVADATRLADRILAELARRLKLAGQEVFVGASVGIAVPGEREVSAEEMLRDVETAMHRARRRGQGSYEVFHAEMHQEATLRLELGMDLQAAIEGEQLFLEFQPIVSVPTGRVVGAEALLRWSHPKQGLIDPSDLIPLAEETGSIVAIGEWVLETACQQNLSWQREGFDPIFVAVNLSAAQLRQRELPARVRGVLRETGLDPALLDLELTETLLMENPDLALDALAALRSTGTGLCVDDFGVGHSSLSYLQRLPLSALKIDRSFVRPMGKEARSDSLMAAIVGMAHSLELKAIAEGVESAGQLDSLRALGCDEYQGYLYSPPLSAEGLAEMLRGSG